MNPKKMGIIKAHDHPLLIAGLKNFREEIAKHEYPHIESIENVVVYEDKEHYYPVFNFTLKIPKTPED
jgi:hypothetical protein